MYTINNTLTHTCSHILTNPHLQATYTTARMGLFAQFNTTLTKMNDGKNLPLWQKALAGLAAGGLGALVGTPADLTLIRMQVRCVLCVSHRSKTKHRDRQMHGCTHRHSATQNKQYTLCKLMQS